jgi:conjugal transfer mating pair stabilization protein TraN
MRARLIATAFAALLTCGAASAQTYPSGACSLIPDAQQCVDSTPCKTLSDGSTVCLAGAALPPGALSVPQTCWQHSFTFACSPDQVNRDTCQPYRSDPKCSLTRQECVDAVPETGRCAKQQFTYVCTTAQATTQKTVCSSGLFSVEPTDSVTNDPTKALIASELVRQTQVYSDKGLDIFKGVPEFCTKGYLGIRSCCKSSPGAKTNAAASNTVFREGAKALKYAGEVAVDWASPYVFDAMYNAGLWNDAMSAMFSVGSSEFASGSLGTSFASGGFSFGAYGFSFSSSVAEGSVQLLATDAGFVTFDPTSFAISVAIALYQQLAACSKEEELLALHRGANLSFYVGRTCAKKVLGSCMLWKDNFCSFNSVLAKVVNVQGKQQLGLDINDCKGLTLEQVTQIDFARVDFSEFASSIAAQASQNLPKDIKSNYTGVMATMPAGSAQGVPGLPTYPSPPPGP